MDEIRQLQSVEVSKCVLEAEWLTVGSEWQKCLFAADEVDGIQIPPLLTFFHCSPSEKKSHCQHWSYYTVLLHPDQNT